VLYGAAAMVLCTSVAPFLLGADFWLSLVAGREIFESGLPDRDTLTILTSGREWVDQQWLAHLLFFSTVRVGGLALATLAGIGTVVGAFVLAGAAARTRGASQRATVIVAFVALLAAPWAFALRAQALALPLFVSVVWLLVDARDGIRRRTFLVIPLLVLWANIHGSVVVGVALAIALAAITVIRRGQATATRAALFTGLAAAAVFATPYGPAATVRYYDRTLLDPSFADLVVEWRRPGFNILTAAFFLLAAATVVLVIWQRRRLSSFELVALALTLGGALTTLRGVVWFVLLAAICLPKALDGALGLRDAPFKRKLNRGVVALVALATLVCALVVPIRGPDWLGSRMPAPLVEPLSRLAAGSEKVWGTDRTSDWLLWRIPELRGRIAYDVRFELLTRREVEALARYDAETGRGWRSITDAYRLIVVDTTDRPSHLRDYASEPGARVIYQDARAALILRPPPRS
jgi:hypothetical protein